MSLKHLIEDGRPNDETEERLAELRADAAFATARLTAEARQLFIDLLDILAKDERVPLPVIVELVPKIDENTNRLAEIIRISREMWP